MTLLFTLVVPLIKLFMLGYAIDTNVGNVRTVFLDQSDTEENRLLVRRFETSQAFCIIGVVTAD
jgi:ABC-2 type transport system permease protein